MRKRLQPWLAKSISSTALLNAKRRLNELKRKVKRQPHLISVFIRADDPYSYLLLQVLSEMEERYEAKFSYHVVSRLQEHMYPEPELWHNNALRDSAHIAELYSLNMPLLAQQRSSRETDSATAQLLQLEARQDNLGSDSSQRSNFVKEALIILERYWAGSAIDTAVDSALEQALMKNDALLDSLGHYLSATLHYGGEWYWGIDRLAHLEERLNNLSLNRLSLNDSAQQIKYQQGTQYFCRRLDALTDFPKRSDVPLIIFFSARSPYSYLGLERGVALAKHYGIQIIVKPVLPMMMRNMYVPPRKQWYIFSDTKREARRLGIDYGFVADPLGVGVERCYALLSYAREHNKDVEYLLSFARAVNANGVHSDTDQGMKTIVEGAGLNWGDAKPVMQNNLQTQEWRAEVERNYDEMQALGLWGVPCFQYADLSVWGQDRVDVIEQAICRDIKLINA